MEGVDGMIHFRAGVKGIPTGEILFTLVTHSPRGGIFLRRKLLEWLGSIRAEKVRLGKW